MTSGTTSRPKVQRPNAYVRQNQKEKSSFFDAGNEQEHKSQRVFETKGRESRIEAGGQQESNPEEASLA